MNNLRLLAMLLVAALPGAGVCAYSQEVIPLEEIFSTAEANSTRLRPAFSAEKVAESEISVAKSNRLPDINASMSVSFIGDGFTTKRNLSDLHSAPIPHLGTGLSLNISQPVYTGGAVTKAIEMAELKSTATRYATDLTRDNIRIQLTGFYLDLYKYHNLRDVVENNIGAARKVLDEMNARFEQGIVLRNDITRYELLLSNLELQLIKINNTIEILNQNLVNISGLPEDCIVIPDSSILERSLPTTGEEWWQKEAELNSPSLKLAGSEVEIRRKAEDLVRSERLPKIGINAGWTMDGPILVEIPPINRNLSYWFVGIGASYNISSLYKSNKALAKSKAEVVNALDNLDAAKEDVRLAVNADHVRYMEAYEELKTQQKSVELAQRNYLTTSTRYSEGMALITDMLDAANSRLDAEQQLVNSRINIIYYYYKLLFISGKI